MYVGTESVWIYSVLFYIFQVHICDDKSIFINPVINRKLQFQKALCKPVNNSMEELLEAICQKRVICYPKLLNIPELKLMAIANYMLTKVKCCNCHLIQSTEIISAYEDVFLFWFYELHK